MLTTNLRRGAGLLDQAILTVGKDPGSATYGFFYNNTYGAMSPDNLLKPAGNVAIVELAWMTSGTQLVLYMDAYTPDSGWSVMTIDGVPFPRTSATYSTAMFPNVQWTWVTATNPFGTTIGATRNVKWY